MKCKARGRSPTPSQGLLEDYSPPAGVKVLDEHQAALRVAVHSVTRAEDLHGETGRRVFQELFHFCHPHPAVRQPVARHGVTCSLSLPAVRAAAFFILYN